MDGRDWLTRTRDSYDAVAESYADLLSGYLDGDPHDRAQLQLFADLVEQDGGGRVLDVGCGPGHLTAHLAGLGLDATGVDLSPAMVRRARLDHPGVQFETASMTDLPAADGSLAGVLAWYSLIHAPDDVVVGVLAGFARALRPGGLLLTAWHVGDVVRRKTQGYGGLPMAVDVHRRTVALTCGWLRDAGFELLETTLREPDAEVPQGRVLARLSSPPSPRSARLAQQ